MEIALIDHVICGTVDADPIAKGYFSFRSAGLI